MRKILTVLLVILLLFACVEKSRTDNGYNGIYTKKIKYINELTKKAKMPKLEFEGEYLVIELGHAARIDTWLVIKDVNKETASGFSFQCTLRSVASDNLLEFINIELLSEAIYELTDLEYNDAELRAFLTEGVEYDVDGEYTYGDEIKPTRTVKTQETDRFKYELYFSPMERETYLEISSTTIKSQARLSYTELIDNFIRSRDTKEWQRSSHFVFCIREAPSQTYEIVLRIREGTKVTTKAQEQSHSYIILSFSGQNADAELFSAIVEILNPEPVDKTAIKEFVEKTRAEFEANFVLGQSYINKSLRLSSDPYIEVYLIINTDKYEYLGYQYVISDYR